jgi:hypothetical protein
MLQQTPDWGSLRSADPEWASVQLTKILSSLEGSEKTLFAVRGMCALLIEERELYRFVIDQEVGDYYVSFDRWLKQTCPNSWSYCRDALRAVKELKDMPFTDLLEIKRANLEQLKKVSSGVRLLPEVVRAAKDMPEKQFVEKMNREHSQHLAVKQPVVMAEPDACEDFEEAIEMAIVCEHCVSRAEAIRAISISYKQDWAVEYERRKAEGAA